MNIIVFIIINYLMFKLFIHDIHFWSFTIQVYKYQYLNNKKTGDYK